MTDIDDLLAYMDSMDSGITFWNSCQMPRETVKQILTDHMKDGVLTLPKEPGTFVAIT